MGFVDNKTYLDYHQTFPLMETKIETEQKRGRDILIYKDEEDGSMLYWIISVFPSTRSLVFSTSTVVAASESAALLNLVLV